MLSRDICRHCHVSRGENLPCQIRLAKLFESGTENHMTPLFSKGINTIVPKAQITRLHSTCCALILVTQSCFLLSFPPLPASSSLVKCLYRNIFLFWVELTICAAVSALASGFSQHLLFFFKSYEIDSEPLFSSSPGEKGRVLHCFRLWPCLSSV